MKKPVEKLWRKKILIKSIEKNENKNSRSINILSLVDSQNTFQKMLSNYKITSINLKRIKSKNDFLQKNFLKSMENIEPLDSQYLIPPKYFNLKLSNRHMNNKQEMNIFSKMNDNFRFNYIFMDNFFKKKESQEMHKVRMTKQKYYKQKYIRSIDVGKKVVNKIFELRPDSKNSKDIKIKIDNIFLKRKMNKLGNKSSVSTCFLSFSNRDTKSTLFKENKDKSKEAKKEGYSYNKRFRINNNSSYNNLIMPSIIKNTITKNKTINFMRIP